MRMLAVDALVTISTWLVFTGPAVMTEEFKDNTDRQTMLLIELFLTAIYMSNCFTTPIIYYVFNNSFKVSEMISLNILV